MIKSMTGAGRGRKTTDKFDITIRAQSVNSRYLDVNVRMSSAYADFENDIRQLCREKLGRGKVDINIDIRDLREDAYSANLNDAIVGAYLEAANKLAGLPEVDRTVNAANVLTFPHALKLEPKELDEPEAFKADLLEAVGDAITDLIKSRTAEGERTQADIRNRIASCESQLDIVVKLTGDVKAEYLQKIRDRIEEMLGNHELDETRLEQEVAFLVDKSDISEEITRLKSHFEAMDSLLNSEGTVGKKLDFTVQEMNREVNTIGSKSKNIEIARAVIEMKSEIEKIREQVQNVE